MNWQKKIKLLCWDLDGTLYPTNHKLNFKIEELYIDAVSKKHNWTREVAIEKIEKKYKKLKSRTKTLEELEISGAGFFTNIWNTIDLNLYIKKNEKLAEMLKKTKLKNGMFTNSNTFKNVDNKLAAIGIDPKSFDFIMTSVYLGFTKPDLKVFEAIIEKSGLQPEEILYIGDRDNVDIIPPKKLGIKTCIVNSKSEYADMSAESPVEVLRVFEKTGN